MLCCESCGKPVLMMTPTQAAMAADDPARYRYLCLDCEGLLAHA